MKEFPSKENLNVIVSELQFCSLIPCWAENLHRADMNPTWKFVRVSLSTTRKKNFWKPGFMCSHAHGVTYFLFACAQFQTEYVFELNVTEDSFKGIVKI